MGTPPFEPTEEQRRQVKLMAGMGVRQPDMAKIVGCSEDTLQRHFRHELDTGGPEANMSVAKSLFQQAMNGNVTAQIFWLKTRARWRTVDKDEDQPINTLVIMGPQGDGDPKPIDIEAGYDPAKRMLKEGGDDAGADAEADEGGD
ncbi:MAG: helix-turn-helix domain-containing protein [Myxococcales bacterium FL481]|nr:MAG: helix-turn-helix domain-containing protein [Myxococcales bacterium FL481]